eukprot:2105611-Amphidinium_carterae.1
MAVGICGVGMVSLETAAKNIEGALLVPTQQIRKFTSTRLLKRKDRYFNNRTGALRERDAFDFGKEKASIQIDSIIADPLHASLTRSLSAVRRPLLCSLVFEDTVVHFCNHKRDCSGNAG